MHRKRTESHTPSLCSCNHIHTCTFYTTLTRLLTYVSARPHHILHIARKTHNRTCAHPDTSSQADSPLLCYVSVYHTRVTQHSHCECCTLISRHTHTLHHHRPKVALEGSLKSHCCSCPPPRAYLKEKSWPQCHPLTPASKA